MSSLVDECHMIIDRDRTMLAELQYLQVTSISLVTKSIDVLTCYNCTDNIYKLFSYLF